MLLPFSPLLLSLSLSLLTAKTTAAPACPLLGSSFPKPLSLSTSPIIASASNTLTSALNTAISTGNTPHGPFHAPQTSFSLQIFTASSPTPLVDFHHTAPSLLNSSVGVKQVDANSVYRIGSITKIFTVLTFLIEGGEARWGDSVVKWVPELRDAASKRGGGGVNQVRWEDVTLRDLASHLAGVGRDYTFTDLLTLPIPVNWTTFGLPDLKAGDAFPCGTSLVNAICSRADFFRGLTTHRPVFLPSTTPIYSNIAFQILAYALESIAHQPFASLLQRDVIGKLGLGSTSYTTPKDTSRGVIPDLSASWWGVDIGDEGPAGAIYTSPTDLTKLGQAILKSTLLTPVQTRRWLKPVTHTSKLGLSVGSPWEIHLIPLGDEGGRLVEVFSKTGDMGTFSAMFALIPEYDLGFTILASGSASGVAHSDVQSIAGLITDIFIPKIESAARDEANTRFAGMYLLPSSNSSLKLSTKEGVPGLGVEEWISHGDDITQVISLFNAQKYGSQLKPSIRLYATNIYDDTNFAFRATSGFDLPNPDPGVFSWDCVTWTDVEGIRFGGVSFDDFVFRLGGNNKATGVEVGVTRDVLLRAATTLGPH